MKPILETFCIVYYLTGIQRFRFILNKKFNDIYIYRGGNSQWIEIIDEEKSKKGIIYNRILNSFCSLCNSHRIKNEIVTS